MYEKMNDELRENMYHNLCRFKKVKAIQAALMFMCASLAVVQLIFLIVGGLNVYCLMGFAVNIVVFLSGTYGHDKDKLHMVLIALNLVLAAAFAFWHPASAILLRIGIMQHIYLAGIMYFYLRAGKEKEKLSYELGYPYFNELAFFSTDDKEYKPSEDIHKKVDNAEMQKIAAEDDPDEVLYREKPVYEDDFSAIDTSNLDTSVIRNETAFSSYSYRQMSEQKSAADRAAMAAEQEPEYDKELLYKNQKMMINYKRFQGALFVVDAIMLLIAITEAGEGLNASFRMLHILSGLAAIIASILTVTCTDKPDLIKTGAFAFAASGIFLTIAFLDIFYFTSFIVYVGQMLVTLLLCKQHDYLKSQFGYPYFKESVLHKQAYHKEYAPAEALNFTQRKMDDV